MRGIAVVLVLWLVSLALAQARFPIGQAAVLTDPIVGGNPIEVRLRLATPASSAGELPVTSSRPDLCQTRPLLLQAGQSEVDFLVPTRGVENATEVIISVGEYGAVRDLRVQLQPETPPVSQLVLPPRMIGGDNGKVVIVLERAASKPAKLSLQGDANLSIASSLTIPAGVRQFEAPFSTRVVRQPGTGSLSYRGGHPVTAQTRLLPPLEVALLQFNPESVEGGQSCQATVTLTGPAPAPARVKIFAPAHLSAPGEVVIPEGSTSATFKLSAAQTRDRQKSQVEAATPLGRKSGVLVVEPSSSIYALEAARYYLMASAREGWLEVSQDGRKRRVRATGQLKLGPLEPFGYSASVAAEGHPDDGVLSQPLTLRLQLTGAGTDWRVSAISLLSLP
ncbi:MAG: hypothetical protein U0931_32115 [Vulcanimicrobiota bacterium]